MSAVSDPVRQSENRDYASEIVVGVDGSDSSMRALEWALDQAEQMHDGVLLVGAWDWPSSFAWGVPLRWTYNPWENAESAISDALERARVRHPNVRVRAMDPEGPVGEALVDVARGARFLVVGSYSRARVSGNLIGSVSDYCVSHAQCPVVVVRGHQAAVPKASLADAARWSRSDPHGAPPRQRLQCGGSFQASKAHSIRSS